MVRLNLIQENEGGSRLISPMPKVEVKCQICRRKAHSALNCYNRLNVTRFPPTHNHELSTFSPNGSNRTYANSVNLVTTGEALIWYPNSRATSHIIAFIDNVQHPRPFSGNHCILTADGSPLTITKVGQSIASNSSNRSFLLRDLLHVPSSTRNLLSVHRFCVDIDLYLIFDS